MSIVYRLSNYFIPGTYQWVKPPTGVGLGPFGSTYLQSIVTVIGAGTGGGNGLVNQSQGTGQTGGPGGNAGAWAQATFLPAALLALEDVVVQAGSLGGASTQIINASTNFVPGNQSASKISAICKFGAHISCTGGASSNTQNGGTAIVSGGSNIINNPGGAAATALNSTVFQTNLGPGINSGAQRTWNATGNSAGAAGGCASFTAPMNGNFGGNGGAVAPSSGIISPPGSLGVKNTSSAAQNGTSPCNGGGASGSLVSVGNQTSGSGANAPPNSGGGGGGGGACSCSGAVPVGILTSGAGGNGSNGAVQIVDIFTLPIPPQPNYFNFDLITWYHMMNMARPISLTGRYQS